MGATQESISKSGNIAWLVQTVEDHGCIIEDFEKRLEDVEREVAGTIKRRDSIVFPDSVKEGPGYKVHVDFADEGQARLLVEAAVRTRQYAQDMRSGVTTVPPAPVQQGASP